MLAARGLTNRDIASRLCLSVRTVEVHIDHILTKLGFRARTRLAAWAHEEGPLAGQGNAECLRNSSDDLPGRRAERWRHERSAGHPTVSSPRLSAPGAGRQGEHMRTAT